MTTTFTTRANDRWDLIAGDLWQLPELGWAIAEANPDIADNLILSAGINLTLPELRSLRRPLTAANPAREDDGEFQQLPPQAPSPIVPPSGGGGSVVFPITVAQGGTGGITAQEALQNLGAVALASVGAIGGVAGLDGSGRVSVANLPPYPTLSSLGGIPLTQKGAVNGVAPLDFNSLVPSLNLPPYPTLTSLGGVSTTTFDNAIALKLDASARNAANGVAGLDVNLLLALSQIPLDQFFPFTAGASFRGGNIPGVGTTLVQAGVDASGNPRLWLVNASAPAGNRLKSITIVSNGNIQLRHHADNGTDGNVLEHTASGNILTNGTLRPGSGNTAFTGASFVAGSIYFRTDVTGDSGVGTLTYSDGSVWRRISNGSLASNPDSGIVDLKNNQDILGNKIFLSKTQFGNATIDFTNATVAAGVGTFSQDAVFSLHCSGSGLGIFAFDVSALRFVIGSNAGRPIDFCTNVGGTPGADNLASATPVMKIINNNIVMVNLPTSASGLTSGMLWRNGNILTVVP
jgi:hypothetical protein